MGKQKQHPLIALLDQLETDPTISANPAFKNLREEAMRTVDELKDVRKRDAAQRIGLLLRQAIELARLVLDHFGDSS
jgi:hypothetical protein